MHPDERIVATGEAGTSPSIYVWESSSKMKVLSKLNGVLSAGVSHLDFGEGGTQLLAVGQDPDHTLVVYDWARGSVIFSAATTRRKVLDAKFIGPAVIICAEKETYFFMPSRKWVESG